MATIEEVRSSLTAIARDLRKELRTVEKALEALNGTTPTPTPMRKRMQRRPAARKAVKRPLRKQSSDRAREITLAKLRDNLQPVTSKDLHGQLNGALSRALVGKALTDLVKSGDAGITGRVQGVRGNIPLYKARFASQQWSAQAVMERDA